MANAQVQTLQYAQNKFGIDSLVFGGHRYRVKNKRNNRVYWRCTIPACPSTVKTHEGHLVKLCPPHNHQANQSKIEYKRSKEELVKLRTPEWNDDTKQIVEQLPTYYSCKTSLYHQRALDRPVLPKTTIDIDLQDEWCLTTTRQQFLLPSDNIYPPMLIFSTTNNLTHLAAANTIFCDGTFYSCPTLFHQLYIVHAMIDGSMFPLVYALLPGKDQACEMIICEAEDSMSANEKKVLHLMPYLNTDNIPIFVLKSLLPNTLSRKEKAILIDHFLRTLDKYSLISHITGLDEHRVVAAHRFTLMIVKASSTAIERENNL
ncbi:unnamed protein product [Mytilus edulis]|uniref:FLYWCH-type domain-containing protein n=1 Tax=Mytilus edulis TaxID=6550 RepID=A0A8S3S6L0_MYTED|nr:unnamed protein product [Mytilus edulis]